MLTIALLRASSCTATPGRRGAKLARRSATVRSTSATASPTDPATCSESPHPIDSTSAGSQAMTTTRPGHAPADLTNRSTVAGSIACGLIASPSSIEPGTDSSSGSITYSVPGVPPCRETSTITSAS